jgi:hypothetical protein
MLLYFPAVNLPWTHLWYKDGVVVSKNLSWIICNKANPRRRRRIWLPCSHLPSLYSHPLCSANFSHLSCISVWIVVIILWAWHLPPPPRCLEQSGVSPPLVRPHSPTPLHHGWPDLILPLSQPFTLKHVADLYLDQVNNYMAPLQ